MNTLRTILEKHQVQIPIIQRDYAQGRSDFMSTEIREKFLTSIHNSLIKNQNLHLDFVYGSLKDNKFIPLDGQQRLTTLFLLYWYLGSKEQKDIKFLQNFTYETRASSREFCAKLIQSKLDFSSPTIVDQIKDSSWFIAFWDNDPTIQAMLNMIATLHKKFNEATFFEELEKITFHFFELENFGLDDDLYVKMNARGKALTEFENFKANFEQLLRDVDTDLCEEFSQKIDNEWTDFFWKFGVSDGTYLIDSYFMRYFDYITEMLYYMKDKKPLNLKRKFRYVVVSINILII